MPVTKLRILAARVSKLLRTNKLPRIVEPMQLAQRIEAE